MTKPTLTYGHGILEDCDPTNLATYQSNEVRTNMLDADATLTCQAGDIFRIDAVPDEAADENVYYQSANLTSLGISTTIYPKCMIRWKTSDIQESGGVGAKAQIVYTDDSGTWIVGDASTPEFSNRWVETTKDLPSGKTVKFIWLYADDYPNSVNDGAHHYVYFDFILIFQGVFTFPFVNIREQVDMENNVVYLKIPGRVGNITQYLGADSPTITFEGTMDTNSSWEYSDVKGFRFIQVWKEMHSDPWQWLTSDLINCKVTAPKLTLKKEAGSKSPRTWSLQLRKYDLSNGADTHWGYGGDLDWLGL